nr:penicillin-binding protein 1a [Candidatus Lariskella arthropodarum]
MRDRNNKKRIFSRRALIIGAIKTAMLGGLCSRYYYLQLIESKKYEVLADNNRIKLIITAPLRGVVLDRNNKELISNKLSYKAVLDSVPQKRAKQIIIKLYEILGIKHQISDKAIENIMRNLSERGQTVIMKNIVWSDIAKIEESVDLSGIEVIREQKRIYLIGEDIAHITGYISKPNAKEVSNATIKNYQEFQIGKNGVEKTFNQDLLGTPGSRRIEVNSLGKFVREISIYKSIPANALKLSISLEVQKIVAKYISQICASAVLLDIRSGEVLAMHSTPSYDPNKFVGGISLKDWKEIHNNPEHPLINKAISIPYPPGSTFKIVTTLAALQNNLDPNRKIMCSGSFSLGGRIFRCWKKGGHGLVNMEEAIAGSCNVYLYTIGLQVGIGAIAQAAELLGLGQVSGIELPFENSGVIPDRNWKRQRFGQTWQQGDTVNASIGQGYVLATPIQIANMMARVASGTAVVPTILHNNGNEQAKSLNIRNSYLDILRSGLYGVFNKHFGAAYTKRRVYRDGIKISGKTGTAQVIALKKQGEKHEKVQHRDHGLFAGFFPADNPKYAIAVVAEHGGWGFQSALPVALNIIGDFLDVI